MVTQVKAILLMYLYLTMNLKKGFKTWKIKEVLSNIIYVNYYKEDYIQVVFRTYEIKVNNQDANNFLVPW